MASGVCNGEWSLLNGHWQRQWPGQNWFYRCRFKNIYRHLNSPSKCALIPHNSKNIFGHKIYMDSRPPAHVPALPNYFSFQVKCLKPNFARLKSQNILYDTLFHDHHHRYLHDYEWCQMCPTLSIKLFKMFFSHSRFPIYYSFLASQDALEVMGVSEWVTESLMVSQLDWCDSGEWWYLWKTLVTWL